MKVKYIIILIFWVVKGLTQTSGIHAHNDYHNEVPFWSAYSAGVSSIEVDVILKDNKLFVAHEEESIETSRTIEKLYLEPLLLIFQNNIVQTRPIQLLVDIKSQALPTLQVLIEKLEPLKQHLYPYNPEGIKVVISGNRPKPQDYSQFPPHVFFDYQSTQLPADLSKIAMLSFDFKDYSKWNGKGKLIDREEYKLLEVIKLAKENHLPIRFWGNPDTKSGWEAFTKLEVDFIGTDNPPKIKAYLDNLDRNSITFDCGQTFYQPKYLVDNSKTKVKNIILFIGDGMGLAHISSVVNFCPDLMLNKFKSIGFSKTYSKNDYTTDSAAGATAFSIGEKTNNRAIGVDGDGNRKPNLFEILSERNYNTAVLTTDEITGATPAAFYAHVEDRAFQDQIAEQLIGSSLNFFMGGGKRHFTQNNLLERLSNKNFDITNSFNDLNTSAERIAFFASDNGIPYWRNGRKDLLPNTVEFALNFIHDQPFFIMVEAAQIDNYGHFNDLKGVAEETIDLDHAIQKAIEFADTDGETLVIVTADHECGGLTIPHGEHSNKELEGEFSTHDHTGVMVPVFAYGPQSSEFQGVYQNSEIFHKILKILNRNK